MKRATRLAAPCAIALAAGNVAWACSTDGGKASLESCYCPGSSTSAPAWPHSSHAVEPIDLPIISADGPEATTTVHVYSNNFSINPSGQPIVDPKINTGDSIHWQWDASTHSVRSVTGSGLTFDSGLHGSGYTFDRTFTQPGIYVYYCENHGSDEGDGTASGMSGTITVIDPTHSTWNTTSSANWDTASSWFGNVPNAVGMHATLGAIITANRTVTLNTGRTVGYLTLNNANRYTISGTGSLTFDVAAGAATIELLSGSHTINTLTTINDNLLVNVSPAASTLTMSKQATAAAGVTITKTGSGTLEMRNVRASGLVVNTGAMLITAGGGTTSTSNVASLSIAAGARVNLTDNDMVVNYTGASPISTIVGLLNSGYANGAWNGAGLTSSSAAAAASTSDRTAIGIAEASRLFSSFPATFSGQSVDDTSIVLMYTLAGDFNLDSSVNISDFSVLAAHFNGGGLSWTDGDTNYSGNVNIADFSLLASNFNKSIAAGLPRGGAVPEPIAFAPLLAVSLIRRFRKN